MLPDPCKTMMPVPVVWSGSTNIPVVVSLSKKWLEALHYCREQHTDLIAGPQLQQLPLNRYYWIGLFRDSWTWSDGNSSSFRNWDVSETVLNTDWNPAAPQCARLSEQKTWKSEDCTEQRPFICYEGLDSLSAYHFININKTWSEAQAYCRDHYTDLATVRNQTEAERVCENVYKCPVSGAWIGLHRPGTTRVWHWSQPALEYQENEQVWYEVITYKQPNYPADGYMESCGLVSNTRWFDENCDSTFFFVCYNSSTNTSVVVSENKKWLEALYFCREQHTDLIAGPQIQLLPPDAHYWMGLFRDSWTWSDGNSSSFRNWDVSINVLSNNWNPNTQQCARLSEQKRWKSEDCTQKRPFICYSGE
ncbi:hypothetical protein WMY93_030688 [Mugilogobius chulae]|uniref:C-type lectin domain-containing protein n=1 Tax=Mugilogobius chulae TaxID=88201 RepID=A0AAW0MSJ1_9GOBI